MLTLMAESGSRVAFLSFILAFIAGGFLFQTKKVWAKILVLGIGALAFLAVWQFLMQIEVLNTRLLMSIEERDLSERDIIWQRLLPLIKSNPLFGVGKTGYADFTQIIFGQFTSPHNVFIEVLCLTGITGLFIYLVFLYRIFKGSYLLYKAESLLLPLLLIIPVLGLLLSGQILFVKIGWVIFAYISGSSITNKTESAHNPQISYEYEDSMRN